MKDLHEQDDNNLASFKKYVILTDRYRYQNDKNTLDYRPAVAVVPHYPLACLPPTCTHTHRILSQDKDKKEDDEQDHGKAEQEAQAAAERKAREEANRSMVCNSLCCDWIATDD